MTFEKNKPIEFISRAFAMVFVSIFLLLAISIIFALFHNIYEAFLKQEAWMNIFIDAINTGIIALAVFELALIILADYTEPTDPSVSTRSVGVTKALPKFVGMVCVALSLEGLIMVIKYSQLELAGNLYYPVAIITSTALLLAALGVFVRLTESPR